ncbi:MAG: HAD hydrolase-like protein [Candidatus Latescibacterota bacterium]|nr:MAG: HAD hydrolase-like protein [Candidatus Latescibacterota bacterium]
MSPRRRLLLFDIDGTLLLSRGRGLQALHATFQQVFGLDPRPAEIVPHGKTDPILFEELGAAYGVGGERLEAKLDVVQSVYTARLALLLRDPQALQLKPGVLQLLQELTLRPDVGLGLVTGNLERTAWLKLEAVRLARFFETGAFGSDDRERAALVRLAVQRFAAARGSVPARHVWVIGDTPDDVASGRVNGVRTLAVATGRHDVAALRRSEPDAVVADLTDTAHVVDILCNAT